MKDGTPIDLLNDRDFMCGECPLDCEGCPLDKALKLAVEALEAAQDNKTFTRKELETWLYANAITNLDGLERDKIFADDCKIIIDRLDGFERFVKDRREGKI